MKLKSQFKIKNHFVTRLLFQYKKNIKKLPGKGLQPTENGSMTHLLRTTVLWSEGLSIGQY